MPPTASPTLGQFLQRKAEQCPETVVLRFVDPGQPDCLITYGSLLERSQTLAVILQGYGITRGVAFGVAMDNHPEWVYALVAASLLGALMVPMVPRSPAMTLAAQWSQAGCRALLVADYALAPLTSALAACSQPPLLLVLHTSSAAGASPELYSDSLNVLLAGPTLWLSQVADDPKQAVEMLYTSGTTGSPKGVMIDHQRLLSFRGLGKDIFAYRADDRLYTGLSLAHGNAQAVTLMAALGQGIEAVFSRRFTASRLWDITRTYGITSFALLGGMATALYSTPGQPDDADNPVRLVTSAGMPAALWEAFEQRFNVRVLEWYGAVEGGLVYKPVGQGPIGSFGRLSPGYTVRVVDACGTCCPPGVVGELMFRPLGSATHPGAPQSKQDRGERGQEAWLRSGDMVHRDAEGYLFFHHRRGEAIRRNGEFINAADIVRVLAEHPAVTDVWVYGVPARSGAPGERDIVAAVVPTQRAHCDILALFMTCRSRLPGNAVPSYIQLVAAIPKTLSEKPLTRLLLEHFDPLSPDVFSEPRQGSS